MKRFYQYTITGLLSMAFLATSCEKEEPDFYDKNENGVYFENGELVEVERDLKDPAQMYGEKK